MAHAGAMDGRPRFGIPRIKIEVKLEREKGGGGGPDPEDKRGLFRRLKDGLRDLLGPRNR